MNNQDDNQDKMQLEIEKHRQETEKEIRNVLNKIFQKQIGSLTYEDKGFLQARESYLSAGQHDTYKDVLAEDLSGQKDTDLNDLTRKELEDKARNLGIEDPSIKNYKTKDELIAAIKAAQN